MPKAKEPVTGASIAQAQQDAGSEGIDNFELPRSLIMKLARASQVPDNTKFSKEVILAILKASTVFINYLAATAHEVASQKQHKSISASDVLKALEQAEFGDIAKSISGELQMYRDLQKADKRKGPKAKAKDAASDSASTASKGKGKAKASTAEGEGKDAPTILIPGRASASDAKGATSLEADHAQSEGADEDQEMADGDEEEDQEEDEEMDDGDEGDEGEAEEPEDLMAMEEELQRDTRGLDDRERGDD